MRYWNGSQWVGDPTVPPGPTTAREEYGSPQYSDPNYRTTPYGQSGGYGDSPYTGPGGIGASTGQGLASPGRRIAARLIDILIGLAVVLVLILPLVTDIFDRIDALGPSPAQADVEAAIEDAVDDFDTGRFLGASVAQFLYEFLMVGFFGGTIGKLALGIRVADKTTGTSPPGFLKAFLRTLNRLLTLVVGTAGAAFGGLFLLVGLASLIMLFADRLHRTVMDHVAQTVVIKQ